MDYMLLQALFTSLLLPIAFARDITMTKAIILLKLPGSIGILLIWFGYSFLLFSIFGRDNNYFLGDFYVRCNRATTSDKCLSKNLAATFCTKYFFVSGRFL